MEKVAMHGHGVRGMTNASLRALAGNADPGKFGLMFPHLEPLKIDDDALFELAQAMKDSVDGNGDLDPAGDNPNIPAGYTYLGQFIDHDITLDTTPLEQQKADPLATTNFRTPALDLDSLYGDGPGIHPYLYGRDIARRGHNGELLIGKASGSKDKEGNLIPDLPNDLPRNQVGHALIGDERNDENLLVAQTHLAFLKFHNAVVAMLRSNKPGLGADELFAEARRIVTWHYQWIALFDFVERLTEPGLVRKIKAEGRRFYRFRSRPYMPAEFSAAAYRLGHSMIRQTYEHNRVFRKGGLAEGTLNLLFKFTGKSGAIAGDLAPGDDGTGFPLQKALPSNWAIDWRRFYELGPVADPDFRMNLSRRLDPFVAPQLHTLPGLRPEASKTAARDFVLPFRNLKRGVQIGLPAGQDVALAMGCPVLTPDQIATGNEGEIAARHGMHKRTPLWYYILKEAEVHHGGRRLGPAGSTIVAETFLGMIHGDHESFLWQRSNWAPELPSETPGHFTMPDLLRFVNDINPVG
jgi:hypothetical protein